MIIISIQSTFLNTLFYLALTLYPKMIELFSRKPIEFPIDDLLHLTPIHIDDDISNLSAILLNEDYYHFLKSGIKIIDGLPVLDEHILSRLK